MKSASTTCETIFLGWDSPLLPRATTVLRDRFGAKKQWSLQALTCVLPSAHGANRFRELLQQEAMASELKLFPPRILTVGELAEEFYSPELPLALEFEQTLAWAHVLQRRNSDELAPLVPVIPTSEAIGPWLELSQMIRGVHEELASSRLSFADVASSAETEGDRRRWNLLQSLYEGYVQQLQDAGLSDPFTSRRDSVRDRRCHSDRTIVLIGTSDLSDALIEMLRALDCPRIAMVAAPADRSDWFDEFGSVQTARWLKHLLPLEDHMLIPAGDMLDQGSAVAEVIAEFRQHRGNDRITVGVTDESQVGPIELELRGCNAVTHRNLGWTVSRTAIGRLFDLTSLHLQRPTWQSLAALARHADVSAWLNQHFSPPSPADQQRRETDSHWLTQLDQLLAEHFPVRMSDPLPSRAMTELPKACEIGKLITRWLAPFATKELSISEWCAVIEKWLSSIYGFGWQSTSDDLPMRDQDDVSGDDVELPSVDLSDPARVRTKAALEATGRVLARFGALNEALDVPVRGAAAVEMLSARLAEVRVQEPRKPDSIDILGWLDLALDDAPALVVDGLNHPYVPQAVTSDPFLPGSLRARLRIADNDRRYARDVYAMHLMISTREKVRFIVGRTAIDRTPTPPSRLLAAAEQGDIARRLRHLLGGKRSTDPVSHQWDSGPDQSKLPIPSLPSASGSITSLSVTAFRDYLICPYRFYLRHVLKLRPLDDLSSEMAANQFGNLIHIALENFGKSASRHEDDPLRIERQLLEHLHQYVSEQYSHSASASVAVQVAQAERRIKHVAAAQARRIADGWRIDKVEASVGPQQKAKIVVDGEDMYIRGRFDRIDVRIRDGKKYWAILDYKTHGVAPEKKHLRKTDKGVEWIDLQLPLYRLMIPYLGIDADPAHVSVGYFNISEKEVETGVNEANFDAQLLIQAEKVIHDCVRGIRQGDFRPSEERVEYDDYGMILQTGINSRGRNSAAMAGIDNASGGL